MPNEIVIVSIGGNEMEILLPENSSFLDFSQSAVREMSESVGSGWWLMETVKREKVYVRLRSIDAIKEKPIKKRKSKKVLNQKESNEEIEKVTDDIY